MTTVNRETIKDGIRSNGNHIFGVTFVKADGTVRKMNCRLGVKKHVKGGHSVAKTKPHLMVVWDNEVKAYRNINLDTLLEVRMMGQIIKIR